MKGLARGFMALMWAVVGCGGGDGPDDTIDDPVNGGFVAPDKSTSAFAEVEGVWTRLGPANWSCLDTPTDDAPTAQSVNLSGVVEDFQTGAPVPDAAITAFSDANLAGAGVATGAADPSGDYSITLPPGGERWAFKVVVEDALDTYLLNQYLQPDDADQVETLSSVSLLTAQALPAFIGVTRTPGLGILAGAIRDCDGNEVEGAIATVSSTPGEPLHLSGAQTYYFSALSTSLPVRHSQQTFTNRDGLFVVIELPAETAYLQVWGFVDDADMADGKMTLIGEIPSPVLSDSVITASMEARRAN